ncbi:MAG TPA: hypothetical protein VFD98_08610 [Terracidiphilus sp.]|jgi:hypothetical protein|nr:hypothetical protein [Terracidiphilus sp.]
MSQQFEQQQMARHVRALYRYNVGQKVGLGWLVLGIGGIAGVIFALANIASLLDAIASRMH